MPHEIKEKLDVYDGHMQKYPCQKCFQPCRIVGYDETKEHGYDIILYRQGDVPKNPSIDLLQTDVFFGVISHNFDPIIQTFEVTQRLI